MIKHALRLPSALSKVRITLSLYLESALPSRVATPNVKLINQPVDFSVNVCHTHCLLQICIVHVISLFTGVHVLWWHNGLPIGGVASSGRFSIAKLPRNLGEPSLHALWSKQACIPLWTGPRDSVLQVWSLSVAYSLAPRPLPPELYVNMALEIWSCVVTVGRQRVDTKGTVPDHNNSHFTSTFPWHREWLVVSMLPCKQSWPLALETDI